MGYMLNNLVVMLRCVYVIRLFIKYCGHVGYSPFVHKTTNIFGIYHIFRPITRT